MKNEFVRTYNPANKNSFREKDKKEGIKGREYLTNEEMFAKLSEKNQHLINSFLELKKGYISNSRFLNIRNHLTKFAYTLELDLDKVKRDDVIKVGGLINLSGMKKASIADQIIDVKQFYKWLEENEDDDTTCIRYSKIIKGLKVPQMKVEPKITEKQILPEEAIYSLIKACNNPRDKFLIALCGLDSPIRPFEARHLKWGDLKNDSFGYYFDVLTAKKSGETTKRPATIVKSLPYLKDWMSSYPKDRNDDYFIFCDLNNANPSINKAMSHHTIQNLFKRISLKIYGKTGDKLNHKVNPYHLRHSWITRATEEGSLTETDIKLIVGHKLSSKVISTYRHIGESHVKQASRKYHDKDFVPETKIKQIRLPKTCPSCRTPNEFDADICKQCNMALSQKIMLNMKKMMENLQKFNEWVNENPTTRQLVTVKKGEVIEVKEEFDGEKVIEKPVYSEFDDVYGVEEVKTKAF